MPKISIIIRTKNEDQWIGHCLEMIYQQDFKDFEIILVDNASDDHTVEIAKRYAVNKIINIDKFLPGLAINNGIRASSGDFIVCISAHCVPLNISWLSDLIKNFDDDSIAGVYGRQLPVSYTNAADKRDLLIVFGQDRRIQIKDYFFHNANSMIRRDIWNNIPFDEHVTNIEDRVWGKAVIEKGYKLIYDPEPAVYHYHGLHQGNKPERIKGVVSIIEKLHSNIINNLPASLKPENINTAAVIPLYDNFLKDSTEYTLLEKLVNELNSSSYVNSVYIFTNDEDILDCLPVNIIKRSNNELNGDSSTIEDVLKHVLKKIEDLGDYPELILYANHEYLSRPKDMFNDLIIDIQYNGHDTVFPGFVDFGHIWQKNQDLQYKQIDLSIQSRSMREPGYRSLYGLGCITKSSFIRRGKLVGNSVGIIPINNFQNTLRLKEIGSKEVIEMLLLNN
ncbi:MAG: glycosyltransferase [Gammaproteobacteria bacterium]|jgi:rhamnosyltransferase|nr:glycosyltransferase [Gammaproteobacteria bacterium]